MLPFSFSVGERKIMNHFVGERVRVRRYVNLFMGLQAFL
jgi:hypothetical protein